MAFSNLFGVATGDEPVSVQHGTIAAVTPLAARRGAYETPYQGPVYVLDAMTNNPGAAGGALTDWQGQLLGMLGKELRNSRNNTWLNYAMPASELAAAVEAIKSGQTRPGKTASDKHPEHPLVPGDLGLVLVPNVLERTPPFVDEVRPDSPAAKAGIHPDDLIVFVENQLVQSCAAVARRIRPSGPRQRRSRRSDAWRRVDRSRPTNQWRMTMLNCEQNTRHPGLSLRGCAIFYRLHSAFCFPPSAFHPPPFPRTTCRCAKKQR